MQKILLSFLMLVGLTCCSGMDNSEYDNNADENSALERSSNSYSKHDVLAQRIATLRNSRAHKRR